MADKEKTHAESELATFFRSYMIYHKQNPDAVLDYTEISMALGHALYGLDEHYSTKEFILSIKSDFEIISKSDLMESMNSVVEYFASKPLNALPKAILMLV